MALVAEVKCFYENVSAREFDLVMDELLLGLLTGDHLTLQFLSLRMLQWTVFMAAYNYRLLH